MGVPERRDRILKLIQQLDLTEASVTWDYDHHGHVFNWWRAVALASQSKPSHVLILEDDAEPCLDFMAAVQRLITIYPERIINFFTAKVYPASKTITLVSTYRSLSDVAAVYPRTWLDDLRRDFLIQQPQLEQGHWQAGFGADEMRVKLRPQQQVWHTVPSLVQHGSPYHSTLRHDFPHTTARSFIGEKTSALSFDWSMV